MTSSTKINTSNADVSLESKGFLRQLLCHISGALEDTVGLDDAENFVSIVGQQIGDEINNSYRNALQLQKLDEAQVADVLVDLKNRIEGNFSVAEQTDEKILLRNNRCPFGEQVIGRESLCMMTSNVFGVISAENLGYARVVVNESIARGNPGCVVTVYLKPVTENGAISENTGREFFTTA